MSNQRHRLMLSNALNSNELSADWIEVEETEPGTYAIVAESLTGDCGPKIAIRSWDEECENCDDYSDLGWMDLSSCVKWQDVEFTDTRIHASSVERIVQGLPHVRYIAYDPFDL